MLKLVTQPRSRRKREWWHVTPGRSGACSVPPPPAEGPADRGERGMSRIRWSAGAGCRSRASPSEPAARARKIPREPTAAAGVVGRACSGDASRTVSPRSPEPRKTTVVTAQSAGFLKSFRNPGASRRWDASHRRGSAAHGAAAALPSPSVRRARAAPTSALPQQARRRRRELSLRKPRMPPHPDRPTLRSSQPPAMPLAYRMRDGSVPKSVNGKTDARGRTVVGAGTGESRPRMQSAATVCAPMDRMPHHRRV